MERTVDILIEIGIYSAVITAFILLFREVFKKRISPKVKYAMWMLLVLRLMLPVTIESGFHVESLLPERTAPVVEQESIFEADTPVISEIPAVNMAPVTEVAPAQPDFDTQGENAVPPVISQEIPESTVVAVLEVKEPVIDINWRIAAFWTWGAGAMAFGLWMMIVKLRFYEDMQQHTTSVSPRVYAIYDECCAALKVKPITMWAVDRAISPRHSIIHIPRTAAACIHGRGRGKAALCLPLRADPQEAARPPHDRTSHGSQDNLLVQSCGAHWLFRNAGRYGNRLRCGGYRIRRQEAEARLSHRHTGAVLLRHPPPAGHEPGKLPPHGEAAHEGRIHAGAHHIPWQGCGADACGYHAGGLLYHGLSERTCRGRAESRKCC